MLILEDAVVTGGVVAVALGALEVAKLSITRLYHRHNGRGKHKMETSAHIDERFVAMVTANGIKIDQMMAGQAEVLLEMRAQGKSLVVIKTLLGTQRGCLS